MCMGMGIWFGDEDDNDNVDGVRGARPFSHVTLSQRWVGLLDRV